MAKKLNEKDHSETHTKPKKKKRKPPPAYIGYVIEIEKYDFNYSLSLGNDRFNDGPFNERAYLKLTGTLHRPVNSKYPTTASIMISGHDRMLEERDYKPQSVGSITTRSDYIDIYIQVPLQRFGIIYQCLRNGGRIICRMTGTRILWRTASVVYFHLSTDSDEEDW